MGGENVLDNGFYLMDCMEGMAQFPDKFFDLAIVDPPYGDGNQKIVGGGTLRTGNQTKRGVTRTGGTWATKYGKKSLRGTLPQGTITFKSCSASHAIRSFGAAITFRFLLQGALWFGIRRFLRTSRCPCANMRGLR